LRQTPGTEGPPGEGQLSDYEKTGRSSLWLMEPNDFVEKLISQASLDAIDFASDVERLMAEQIAFLREQIEVRRQEAVCGAHDVIRELYARISDKDAQIIALREEVRFLRTQLAPQAS